MQTLTFKKDGKPRGRGTDGIVNAMGFVIGREIVLELLEGGERAEFGMQGIEDLSERLTKQYGKGFSTTNLWYFRQFYQTHPNRLSIRHLQGCECAKAGKLHPAGGELPEEQKSYPTGSQSIENLILFPPGRELSQGFSPQLSWSHYRALMQGSDGMVRQVSRIS